MKSQVRILSQNATDTFSDWLEEGPTADPPFFLLTDEALSSPLRGAREVESKQFSSLYDLGVHVVAALANSDFGKVDPDPGVWNWLSLFFINTLAPLQPDGNRKLLAPYNYILTEGYRTYFRHMVRQSVILVRMHGELARLFLTMVNGGIGLNAAAIEFGTRQELITNHPLMEVAHQLYFDHRRKRLKHGTSSTVKPGVIRRFAAVAQQLDLTHDLQSMAAEKIAALLPRDFDRWRARVTRAQKTQP